MNGSTNPTAAALPIRGPTCPAARGRQAKAHVTLAHGCCQNLGTHLGAFVSKSFQQEVEVRLDAGRSKDYPPTREVTQSSCQPSSRAGIQKPT
jgi:hypothetical protein